jgi:hypothetical protein
MGNNAPIPEEEDEGDMNEDENEENQYEDD